MTPAPRMAAPPESGLSDDTRVAVDHATQRLLLRAMEHRVELVADEEARRGRLEKRVWRLVWLGCAALAAFAVLWMLARARVG